jgi:hypothetical protein
MPPIRAYHLSLATGQDCREVGECDGKRVVFGIATTQWGLITIQALGVTCRTRYGRFL